MAIDIDQTVQQADNVTVRELGAALPQGIIVPPAPAAVAAGSVDLGSLSTEELEALRGGVTLLDGAVVLTTDVTLPVLAETPDDWTHTFLSVDAAANNVDLNAGAGNTINGAASFTLDADHEYITVYKPEDDEATDWLAIGTGLV